MNWLDKLELVQLLRTVMVSVDERWDVAGIQFDAVYFLVMLCSLSILSYCLDIYQLVKRTTMTETMIGMLLPGMAALSGAVCLTEYGSLPSGQVLSGLAEQPFSLALSEQLLACAILFVMVFAMTRLCWRKNGQERPGEKEKRGGKGKQGKAREDGGERKGGKKIKGGKEEWRWAATYAIDFLAALMAFAAGCYGVFTNVVLHRGRNFLQGAASFTASFCTCCRSCFLKQFCCCCWHCFVCMARGSQFSPTDRE